MKKVIIGLLISSTFSAFAGGGWVAKKGEGYFKLNQSYVDASSFFNAAGESISITGLGLYTTAVYGEYGITDKLTAIAYSPLFVRTVLNREVSENTGLTLADGDTYNGYGDSEIGIKYGIIKDKPVVFAVTLMAGIPSGATGVGNTELLQTGDGEFNQLIQFDVSSSKQNFFFGLKTGFNNRSNDFSEEFRYGGEFGYAKQNWYTVFKYDGVKSFNNGDVNAGGNGGSIFSNNIEFDLVSLEGGYFLNSSLGVSAAVLYPLAGKRVLDAPNFNLGVFYKLAK